MAMVIVESRSGLVERRRQLLKSVGLTEAELRVRAVERSLTSAEADVLEELDEIGFLLGET